MFETTPKRRVIARASVQVEVAYVFPVSAIDGPQLGFPHIFLQLLAPISGSASYFDLKTCRARCPAPLHLSPGSQTHRMTYATSFLKLSADVGKTPRTAGQRQVGEFRSFSKFRRSMDPS